MRKSVLVVAFLVQISGSAWAGGAPTLGYLPEIFAMFSYLPVATLRASTRTFTRYKNVMPIIEADVILYRVDGQISNLLKSFVEDLAEQTEISPDTIYARLLN